jgi:DNA polymerase-3 subunit delta
LSSRLEQLLAAVAAGSVEPAYLVAGDLVLAEPAARRLAEALASRAGCEVVAHRRPSSFVPLLEDLRTYSLFSPGKVLLAVDTAILAERGAAADLIDDVADALPVAKGEDALSPSERQAASRLLQVLRLFQIDPHAGSVGEVIGELPDEALQGGQRPGAGRARKRSKARVEELGAGLAELLESARVNELQGWGESDLVDLAALIQDGLPAGHSLVLAERSVARDQPVVQALEERGAVISVGRVKSERGRWQGVEELAQELREQTGVAIEDEALQEMARRTLRQEGGGRFGSREADADSTARFAAEYRKLANLAAGGRIDAPLVEDVVRDRGEEDVWQLLDAVGAGRAREAVERLDRLLKGAEDPTAARLAFFALLASYCRQITAVQGLMKLREVPEGETSYGRFKSRWAPLLLEALPNGAPNPVAKLHPYRLHRTYLAAGRIPAQAIRSLPWRVLETELQLKGESGDPDTALTRLLVSLAGNPATS